MDEVLKLATFLQAIGPFTAPLCVALSAGSYAVIKWLLNDRKALQKLLKAATDDATNLRERRATDLERAGREIQKITDASHGALAPMRDVLLDIMKILDRRLPRPEREPKVDSG